MRTIPILNKLKNVPEINRFVTYMLDNTLHVESKIPGVEQSNKSGYKMQDFLTDNQLVITWFATLQMNFNQWRSDHSNKTLSPVKLEATGSRSFGASYTESDLECAIVSENFEDFLDFGRFLNAKYGQGHNFTAIKTAAGLPLLIIKGDTGFCCPELSKAYPGKTLPQLEVTFRHPGVHQIIQDAGVNFFATLSAEELESYVFNKRFIELMQRGASVEAVFEGEPLKKGFCEAFKGSLSKPLKCLPPGKLQDTPDFNKQVFADACVANKTLSQAVESGLTLFKKESPDTNRTQLMNNPNL